MAEARNGVEFDQVTVIASDVDAAVAFYRLLGVEIPEESIWRTESGAHHVGAEGQGVNFDIDSTRFAPHFTAGWESNQDLAGRVMVGFRVETRAAVDERFATMTAAGYHALQAPFDAFWGARYAVVEDPDGVAVGIMSEPDASMRGAPPDV